MNAAVKSGVSKPKSRKANSFSYVLGYIDGVLHTRGMRHNTCVYRQSSENPSKSLISRSYSSLPSVISEKNKTKICMSCKTTESPCWRPSWKTNNQLCNSCGLRFKKSRSVCSNSACGAIPTKSESETKICRKCDGKLKLIGGV